MKKEGKERKEKVLSYNLSESGHKLPLFSDNNYWLFPLISVDGWGGGCFIFYLLRPLKDQ